MGEGGRSPEAPPLPPDPVPLPRSQLESLKGDEKEAEEGEDDRDSANGEDEP